MYKDQINALLWIGVGIMLTNLVIAIALISMASKF